MILSRRTPLSIKAIPGEPLFNDKGEVIGINTAIFSPSGGSVGIGFAVPTAMAKSVFAQLKNSGHIDRGWLGIKIQPVTEEVAESVNLKKVYGAFVANVGKDSPAEKAGVLAGDVITKFDGKDIKEMRTLPRVVADTKVGKSVSMEIWRKGHFKVLTVMVGETKEEATNTDEDVQGDKNTRKTAETEIIGLALVDITPEAKTHFALPDELRGGVITRIKPESEAKKRGLKVGDVILQVGDTVTLTAKEVGDAINALRHEKRKFALLRIARGKEDSVFITLPVEEVK